MRCKSRDQRAHANRSTMIAERSANANSIVSSPGRLLACEIASRNDLISPSIGLVTVKVVRRWRFSNGSIAGRKEVRRRADLEDDVAEH